MELDRVKLLREAYMQEATRPNGTKSTLGEYMRLCLDGGLDLVTSKDLVVFDDDNEMAHAVCINEDMKSQATYPVKIISTEYAIIQQIETIMSQENFEKFLENGFFNISEAKKEAMIKWTRGIKNQAQQPMEAEPYFNTNPTIIPMAHSKKERESIIVPTATVVGADGAVRKYASMKEMLTDLQDGDVVTLNANVVMGEETIDINNGGSVTLNLGGNTITSSGATAIKITNGTLTVDNGSVVASGEVFRVDTREGGTAELILGENVEVVSETDCCIYTRGTNTITSAANLFSNTTEYAVIQGNGTDSGSIINITGGSITGDMPIYQPQKGVLNISGGTITGSTPIYVKAGEVNISGGKFIATGEAVPYTYNGNGGNSTGDALVVDFCDYPGGMPTVTITGGEFTSLNAKAYETYNKEGNTNPEVAAENVKISGGVFDTKPYAENIEDGMSIEYNDVTNRYYVIVTPPTSVIGADGEVRVYTTSKEALADLRDGDTVTVITNVDLAEGETIEVAEGISVSIDLGGNTINAEKQAFTVSNGSLEITNGTINSKYIGIRVDSGNNAATLTLGEGVTINGENGCCIYTRGNNTITTAADLTMTGECAVIQGNGNDLSEAVINIVGGNITSEDNAIYLPSNATVNVSGGTITGATGIYIKSGKLNISGGTITGNGPANGYAFNGNGAGPTGDALVVDFCDYPAGDPEVTITGGNLVSLNAKAYNSYNKDGTENPEGYDDKIVISGGVFSTEPYANNLVEGASVIYDPNENTYSVSI